MLPEEALTDAESDREAIKSVVPHAGGSVVDGDENEGLPWFDTMIQGSKLGKMRRQGEKREGKGWKVEWEIVEWTDGDEGTLGATTVIGKRKLGNAVADDEDLGMD